MTAFFPKTVGWDAARGILAAIQQWEGLSPNIITLALADESDLSRTHFTEVTYWAPGYQALPWLLRHILPGWDASLRILCCFLFIVKAAGIYLLLRLFIACRFVSLFFTTAYLTFHFNIVGAFSYAGGDDLVIAVTPWILWFNIRTASTCTREYSSSRNRSLQLLFLGIATGGLYFLKYSAASVGVGVAASHYILLALRRLRASAVLLWSLGFAMAGIASVLYSTCIIKNGTPAATFGADMAYLSGLNYLYLWIPGMNGIFSLFTWVNDQLSLNGTILSICYIAAFFVLFLIANTSSMAAIRRDFALLQSREGIPIPYVYLIVTLFCDIALYLMMVSGGANVAIEPRLARISGLLAYPLVCVTITRGLAADSIVRRSAAAILMIISIGVPSVYGIGKLGLEFERQISFRHNVCPQTGIAIQHLDRRIDPATFYAYIEEQTMGSSKETVGKNGDFCGRLAASIRDLLTIS